MFLTKAQTLKGVQKQIYTKKQNEGKSSQPTQTKSFVRNLQQIKKEYSLNKRELTMNEKLLTKVITISIIESS